MKNGKKAKRFEVNLKLDCFQIDCFQNNSFLFTFAATSEEGKFITKLAQTSNFDYIFLLLVVFYLFLTSPEKLNKQENTLIEK